MPASYVVDSDVLTGHKEGPAMLRIFFANKDGQTASTEVPQGRGYHFTPEAMGHESTQRRRADFCE